MTSQPVLLLMDYQEAICHEDGAIGRTGLGSEVARRGVLAKAQQALARFRAEGRPVIHVRVALDDRYLRLTSASPGFAAIKQNRLLLESDPGTAICTEVAPLADELVVTKGGHGAFGGTNLAAKLHALRPTELVLGGVATNHVVESTARHAVDIGFPVVVLEDLCASFTDELHEFAITQILPRYATITTLAEYVANTIDPLS